LLTEQAPTRYTRVKADAKGCHMTDNGRGIQTVTDDELRLVRGGKSFWDRVKGAAKWAKDHVVGGAKWIGLKFRF
jgi:bacillopeptidase F (M6 metalloprotease family)